MIIKTGRVPVEWADFARQLERELARAMKALNAAGEQIEHFEQVVQSLAKRDQ